MVQKTIQDYYEAVCQEYPDIPESDIKRILNFGFKSLYLHNSYGGDVLVNRKDFWFYTGRLTNDSLLWFNYYVKKLITKIRILYKRKGIEWDGYYYFALSAAQYADYLSQKNKKGRPRKKFTFKKIVLYKIYDECNIAEHAKVAIFRVPMNYDNKLQYYHDEVTLSNIEMVLERNPLKLQDILLSNYQFKF